METGEVMNDELFHELQYDESQYVLLVNDKHKNGYIHELNVVPGLNETTINITQYGSATGGYELVNINNFQERCTPHAKYVGYYNIKIARKYKNSCTNIWIYS